MRDMRLLIGLGALVALVALFLVFRPGGRRRGRRGHDDDAGDRAADGRADPDGAETETATTSCRARGRQLVVTIRGGEPVGGIVRAEANKGDPVVVIVRSDVADEVHVHGYDLMADVAPGKPARIGSRQRSRAASRSSSRTAASRSRS